MALKKEFPNYVSVLSPPFSQFSKILALSQLGRTKMTAQLPAEIPSTDIQYGIIKVEDTDAVIEMLQGSFFKVRRTLIFYFNFSYKIICLSFHFLPLLQDEPLNTYLELGECQELVDYASKSIKDECSFKAMSPSGEIIGVFLNGYMKRPAPDTIGEPAALSCEHEKFRKILGLMDLVESKFSIFDLYPEVDVALDGKILAVDTSYRGKGIANELTRLSLDFMRDNSIPLMNVLCTSHFSAQLMKKLKFDSVFVLPLADYVDADGVQILQPDLPHVQAEVLVKWVD